VSDLRDYILQFKPSRPIFTISVKINRRVVNPDFTLELCQEMDVPDPGNDVINQLAKNIVAQEWNLKKKEFTIDARLTEERVYFAIHNRLLLFLDKNMNNERPRQTLIYRWTSNQNPTHIFRQQFVELYKYIVPFCDSTMFVRDAEHCPHCQNVILILQAMQEKCS
jgi:hypothetical protein